MKTNNVLLGVVGGLAAGAVLGVLFAPDKGSNTRKKIAKKSSDLKENAKESFDKLVNSIENQYEKLATKADKEIEKGKSTVELINKELKA
ncbi:YtxH domain-containing protein [Flavobacterium sp. SUN052]|uniref:YtxH domain-containing protein n=1 Tax=Flavobacterium sp. SUN052 TaxID=3002441 RepID=UPI00237DD0D2|nr:YtxH domain-containing protein [Flavobacterium sp. SUN052]MEC4005720.1 YtxH domain-containing protein [Flavobacterium sp. SUN052]